MKKLKKTFRDFIWKTLKLKITLRSGLQVIVDSDSDWVIYNEIFVNDEYDEVLRHLHLTGERVTVFDLGANVGYFSLKIADYFLLHNTSDFKIIAVEADPVNYRKLYERTNSCLKPTQLVAKQGLVGKLNGTANFNKDPHHFGHSIIETPSSTNRQLLSYIDLNDLLAADEKVQLIKCDIEGSEIDFIMSYPKLLQRTELFICEFHYENQILDKLRILLQQQGLKNSILLRKEQKYNTTVELFTR